MTLRYDMSHTWTTGTQDHLAWIASSRAPISSDVIVENLTKPSIKSVEMLREMDLMIIDGAEQQPKIDWMSPIKMYLDI
jgi:hypothetical protein